MQTSFKVLIAGVGGQGVVYLTNLIVEAALLANIPVATSEIHGLSQRGGSVTAGITFGEDIYGFIEEAGADYLLGLEPLEAQRCIPYLHTKSRAVIDNNRIAPFAVNAELVKYPDTIQFINYLNNNIEQTIFINSWDNSIDAILRNIYLLGKATQLKGFPLSSEQLLQAISFNSKKGFKEKTEEVFKKGMKKEE